MLLKKTFYFLRHGQTDHNRNKLCAGSQIDAPLNTEGKRQAKQLNPKIAQLPVRKIVCSPMKRAVQTAKLASPLPLTLEHDIRECHLGDFEGRPYDQLIKHYEDSPYDEPFPNGESRLEVATRALVVVNKFLSDHGENMLFVSHGIVYWSLLERLGIPFQHIENAEIVQFKYQQDAWAAQKV